MAEANREKYTIGQMSEICNVSTRILRYYDQVGILQPFYRDDSNRYRYYSEKQIEDVLLLQELRDLNFPVRAISKLFQERDLAAFETELEQRLRKIQGEIEDLWSKHSRTLDILMRVSKGRIAIEQDRQVPERKIQIDYFHERTVVYTRYPSSINAKKLFLSRRAELLKLVSEHQYEAVGSNMAVFHSGYLRQFSDRAEDECGDLEVLIQVKNGKPGKDCRVIRGFDAVSGVFIGPYSQMEPFYQKMVRYAQERHIALEPVSIEEYLVGATMTNDPDNYVTKIYLPFKGQF